MSNGKVCCKYIRKWEKGIVVKLFNGDIQELKMDTQEDMENILSKYTIINMIFNAMVNKLTLTTSEYAISNYVRLSNENSKKSAKAYSKTLMLGIESEEIIGDEHGSIVIMDHNNYIKHDIKAESISFIGEMPIKYKRSGQLKIECKMALIDNQCVYAYILPINNPKIVIYANTYLLKHDFIDKNTVYEIFTLFDIVYGVKERVSRSNPDKEYYQEILIDTSKSGLSGEDIENAVRLQMDSRLFKIDMSLKLGELQDCYISNLILSSYATCFSMYKSLSFQSTYIKSVLTELSELMDTRIHYYEHSNFERYRMIKDKLEY